MPYLQSMTLQIEVPPVVTMANEMEASHFCIPISVEAGSWKAFNQNFQNLIAEIDKRKIEPTRKLLEKVDSSKIISVNFQVYNCVVYDLRMYCM